ncbi:MAG: hypothetical protein AB8B82_03435 [Roseovarius sp.]
MRTRFLPGLALVVVQVSAFPTTSAAQGIDGMWCTQNETMNETIHIDAYGIGFNEHTMCDVANLPVQMDAADRYTSAISCRNVHIIGRDADGNYETHETPVDGLTQISLRGAADGTLILSTDLHAAEMHFLPCE